MDKSEQEELECSTSFPEYSSNTDLMEPTSSIHFSDFSFRYGTKENSPFALKNISLSIPYGDIVLIGGISGSGKSTLCNAIAGRIPFNITGQMSGKIKIFGKDIWNFTPEDLSKKISVIFQNAEEQLVTFTVYDELAFAAENLKLEEPEIRKRVENIATSLGIKALLERPILQLSGGEKQKVVIGAALVMSPEILILDEPLAFLDKIGESMLHSILKKIHKQNPKLTIIIVEHRLNPFSDLLDKILLLDSKGYLIFNNTLDEYRSWVKTQQIKYLRDENFQPFSSLNPTPKSLFNTSIQSSLNSSIQSSLNSSIQSSLNSSIQSSLNSSIQSSQNSSCSPIMEIKNVSFSYYREKITHQNYVLNNFSLEIFPGDFLGIVGNNGSGKTTLLYLLAHILEPNQGDITFNGISLNDLDLEKFIPNIGFIFQNPENQIFETKIKREILYAPRNFQLLESKQKSKIKSSLLELNEQKIISNLLPLIGEYRHELNTLADQNPFSLSWGQKRRLNLASIFSYSPEILLIDEPFIGQDAASVQHIFNILKDFHQQGKTIIIVSHDRILLERNCSRIVNLDDKKIVAKKEAEIIRKNEKKEDKNILKTKKKSNHRKTRKIKRIEHFLNQQDQYIPINNWLHKLNPVAKIVSLILFTGFLFTTRSILILFLAYIFTLLLAKAGNIPISKLIRQIRWIFILTIIYIPLNTLFSADFLSNDQILFYFFTQRLPVRRLAFYYSLRTGLIILILISTGVIFTKTSTPKDIVFSLIQLGIPYRFAFAFMIGLRYIPLIEQESNTIEIAQTLRGFGIKKGSSIHKIFNHILQQISTLLISILRKTKITALTIESRGFGVYKKRTNLHHVRWNWQEW
ncbi:MAG: ATP-binding cassette domain-containing protein, partial [Promethearchaeota archaeon]